MQARHAVTIGWHRMAPACMFTAHAASSHPLLVEPDGAVDTTRPHSERAEHVQLGMHWHGERRASSHMVRASLLRTATHDDGARGGRRPRTHKHEPRAEQLHMLSSRHDGSWSCSHCGESGERGKMTYTKLAFLSRTSSSASNQEQLEMACQCCLGMLTRANLRALQMHRTCCCNCAADEDHRARKHVASNVKDNREREDSAGCGRALLLSIFRGSKGQKESRLERPRMMRNQCRARSNFQDLGISSF